MSVGFSERGWSHMKTADITDRLKDMAQWLWTTPQELERNLIAKAAAEEIERLQRSLPPQCDWCDKPATRGTVIWFLCDDCATEYREGIKANARSPADLTATREKEKEMISADSLVLCRSDRGDGGWSLHAPGSTDEDIANGDAPYLVSGTAEWDEASNTWNRPNYADFIAAIAKLA